jgi:nucleotide-binding universal stress UspA family protein
MKIVVAIDGSKSSDGALSLARHYPHNAKEITLLHVKPTVLDNSLTLSSAARKEFEKFVREIEASAEKIIAEGEKALAGSKAKINYAVVGGNPAEAIIDYLDRHKSDLVIMGARGHNPLESFFIGSVADTVLRHAHCSILLFRGTHAPTVKAGKKLSITMGFDDSPSAREAMAFIQRWDHSHIARIYLAAYAQMSFYYGMTYSMEVLSTWPLQKQSLEEGIVAAEGAFKKAHSPAEIVSEVIVDTHDVADELNTYAKKHHCDLIVVGSKGKNLLDRIMLGSVSNKLAHRAEVPVLIVR